MTSRSRPEHIQLKPLHPQNSSSDMKKKSKPPVLLKIMRKKCRKTDSSQQSNPDIPIITIAAKQKEESDGKSQLVFV